MECCLSVVVVFEVAGCIRLIVFCVVGVVNFVDTYALLFVIVAVLVWCGVNCCGGFVIVCFRVLLGTLPFYHMFSFVSRVILVFAWVIALCLG